MTKAEKTEYADLRALYRVAPLSPKYHARLLELAQKAGNRRLVADLKANANT